MPPFLIDPSNVCPKVAEDLDFKRVLDTMTMSHMIMDAELRVVYANPAYLTATQRTADQLIGEYVFEAFPDTEERKDEVRKSFEKVLSGENVFMRDQDFMLEHADGTRKLHTWRVALTPYFGDDGAVKYIVQHARDITEQKELEARNRTISNELDHRVKNMYAIIQSMAELTGNDSDTIADYREAFSARLVAMGRTHTALSENNWRGLDIKDIIEAEISQYRAECDTEISINGAPLTLSRKSSQDASMLVHELATNAARYGCFSNPGSKLYISWRIDLETRTAMFEWTESGMTDLEPPTHEGFGSILATLMPNLKMEREFRPEGLSIKFWISTDIAVE